MILMGMVWEVTWNMGQFVGSLGRHETVQMAGFESDDDDDFWIWWAKNDRQW